MDIKDYYVPETLKTQDYHLTLTALENESKYVTQYKDGYVVYHRPNTIEYNMDCLFKKLINRCIEKEYYDYVNDATFVNPLMWKSFENMIYKFTYQD